MIWLITYSKDTPSLPFLLLAICTSATDHLCFLIFHSEGGSSDELCPDVSPNGSDLFLIDTEKLIAQKIRLEF